MAVIVVTLPFHNNDNLVALVMTSGQQLNATSRGEEKLYIHDTLRSSRRESDDGPAIFVTYCGVLSLAPYVIAQISFSLCALSYASSIT
jgi:hypothetical protein